MALRDISCVILLYFLFVAEDYHSAPANENTAIDFMKKYGYLQSGTEDSEALYKKTAITEAVTTLQKFANIPVTGQLDNTTLELMASPRCGVPDVIRKEKEHA